jgi:hypothetical protein
MVSATLQSLINKGLFDRIPPTFSTFFFEQIKEWDTLFPAEQRYFERLFTLIDRLPDNDWAELFQPLVEVEKRMGVNPKTWPRRTFSLDQVDFLNRNPHYGDWRKTIAGIFARLDPVLEEQVRRQGRPRAVFVLSPGDLPVGPDRLWTRLKGRRVALDAPLDAREHIAPLFTMGEPRPYDRWIVQTQAVMQDCPGSVVLDYEALNGYRRRLMSEVRRVVETEKIQGPRELGAQLKKLKILASEGALAKDPVLAEFTRAVLLAGNGTLLINNTFVEWATIQAVRRARPSLVAVNFGIRNKLKPFSSLLIYTDQETANPIPSQMDTLGSYVDLEIFYQYVWQEFEKYAEYQRNTVYVFGAQGMDETLVIAPPDFEARPAISPAALMAAVREWLHL